jgi:predicted aminopeptidase
MNWKRVRRVTGLVLALAIGALALSPTGCYLGRAGWEEAKILKHRKLITSVAGDTHTDSATRAKLRIVLAARRFAADSVRLRAGDSFTKFTRLERDTLTLVLSGAYRDQLRPYTWWFPIVGRVPYKGYFDFAAGRQAAQDLSRRGFDVYLRPTAAFSTLGWFNDPLLSTTLALDSLELANTVIHELTHNTFYAGGQAIFNESFANFVGSRGAAWFFRSRGDSAAADTVDLRWSDELALGAFWTQVYRQLDSAFAALPGSTDSARAQRLAARERVYAEARVRLAKDVAPRFRTIDPGYAERVRMDNAALLARRIYLTDLDLFERTYDREAHDLPRTVQRVIGLAKTRPADPYGALRDWLGGAAGAVPER